LERGQDAATLSEYENSIAGILGRQHADVFARSVPTRVRSGNPLFQRLPDPRGPLMVFGYDYFVEHAKAADIPTPRLLSYEGAWGSGEVYAYEALNFCDGSRSARQITEALSAEFGSVPQEIVVEYLRDLEKIGLVQQR
jgi:hypothetical protein